jgi:hypothetical protein
MNLKIELIPGMLRKMELGMKRAKEHRPADNLVAPVPNQGTVSFKILCVFVFFSLSSLRRVSNVLSFLFVIDW